MGVNVAAPKGGFSGEIKDIADSIFESSKVPSLVYCALLDGFLSVFKGYYAKIEEMPHLAEYRRNSYLDGKKITYNKGGESRVAEVLGIGDNAELIVKEKGKTVSLTSGEVQIKL